MICSYTAYVETKLTSDDVRWRGLENVAWAKNCPYCASQLDNSISDREDFSSKGSGYIVFIRLLVCPVCGWWMTAKLDDIDNVHGRLELGRLFQGEAKRYSVDALDVPIEELRSYLMRNPLDLGRVSPTRFEFLVRDCLRDFFPGCEVIHTGRSADGGVDLKMLHTKGEIYLIQVKRRSDVFGSEGVEVVRSLNGVLFREGLAKGMVVTTAQRFTPMAQKEASVRTPTRSTYEMHLVGFADLVGMLRLPRQSPYQPWYESLCNLRQDLAERWSWRTQNPAMHRTLGRKPKRR